MTDTDYTNDLVLLANTPAQTKYSLYCWEQAVSVLHVNADKTEFMCFNQDGATFTSNGKPLKLVDQFTYFDSNISSTETDVYKGIEKIWTVIICRLDENLITLQEMKLMST